MGTRDNGFKSKFLRRFRKGLLGAVFCKGLREELSRMAFLRMNGREEELEDRFVTPCSMLAFGLTAEDNPIATSFRLFERVETAGNGLNGVVVDDNLDASSGFTTATMHNNSAHLIVKTEVEIVQNRVDMTMVGFMFGFLLHMR